MTISIIKNIKRLEIVSHIEINDNFRLSINLWFDPFEFNTGLLHDP